MNRTTYTIPKGLTRPIQFKGLKGHCIVYAVIGLLALMTGYLLLQLVKIPAPISLPATGIVAVILFRRIIRLNSNYTRHGIMKRLASKRTPPSLRADTRKAFQKRRSNS